MKAEWGTDYWGEILSEPTEAYARKLATFYGVAVYVRSHGDEWRPAHE